MRRRDLHGRRQRRDRAACSFVDRTGQPLRSGALASRMPRQSSQTGTSRPCSSSRTINAGWRRADPRSRPSSLDPRRSGVSFANDTGRQRAVPGDDHRHRESGFRESGSRLAKWTEDGGVAADRFSILDDDPRGHVASSPANSNSRRRKNSTFGAPSIRNRNRDLPPTRRSRFRRRMRWPFERRATVRRGQARGRS